MLSPRDTLPVLLGTGQCAAIADGSPGHAAQSDTLYMCCSTAAGTSAVTIADLTHADPGALATAAGTTVLLHVPAVVLRRARASLDFKFT